METIECPGAQCLMCIGEACNKCGAGCWSGLGTRCEHGSDERHAEPAPCRSDNMKPHLAVVSALDVPAGRVDWSPGRIEVVLPDGTVDEVLYEVADKMAAIRPDHLVICVMRAAREVVIIDGGCQ